MLCRLRWRLRICKQCWRTCAAKVRSQGRLLSASAGTRKTLRDASAQVAGARWMSCIPLLYLEDAALDLVQSNTLCCSWCSSLHCDWLCHGSESHMHDMSSDSRCCVHMRRCCMELQGATVAAALLGARGGECAGYPRLTGSAVVNLGVIGRGSKRINVQPVAAGTAHTGTETTCEQRLAQDSKFLPTMLFQCVGVIRRPVVSICCLTSRCCHGP